MKRLLSTFLACCSLLALNISASAASSPLVPDDVDRVALKNTARLAVEEVVAKFVDSQSTESIKTYALFPVSRDFDSGYYTTLFAEAFTEAASKAGLELITAASSKEFNQILEGFAAGQDNEAALDESKKLQIGKIIDYQAILLPRIDVDRSPDGTYSLKASVKVIYREVGKARSFGSKFHIVPHNDFLRYAAVTAGGLVLLLVLVLIMRAARRAARPR